MFKKIKAGWRVLQAGQVVLNPTAWKKGQIGANAVAGLLVALVAAAEAFGYEVPISGEGVDAVAAGLFVVGNVVCTLASSDKVGVPAKRRADN